MPWSKYTVLVDFDQDGDFTDVNSDITSDVRQMKWSRGKNLAKQRAEAAVIDLVLNNDDHKYSPSKETSPLYPGVLLSPYLWAMIGYPVDTFTAANGTTLTGRRPDYDELFDAWSGDSGNFQILSNKLSCTVAANKSAVVDFGESDCFVGVKFTRNGTGGGLLLRYTDANNYWLVRHDGASLLLQRCQGGTLTTEGSATVTWAAGQERLLIAELHGTTIRVFLDDALQFSANHSFNETATKHGVGGHPANMNDRWDDFGGWRTVFYGRIDTIQPRPEVNRQYAYIRAFDDMERMGDHLVCRTSPTGGNVTAKAILDEVLDAAGADASSRILDTGTVLTKDDKHEKSLGRDALTEVYQVQDDDVGFFYIDGAGVYRYEDSDHRDSAPHTTGQQTWRADRLNNDQTDIYISGLQWDDGKERVENEGYFLYYKIARTTAVEVWRLNADDVPPIDNGNYLEFLAVGEGDHIANPILPHHTTDFTVNTAADGSGTDLLVPEDSEQGVVGGTGSPAFELDDSGQDFKDWNDGLHQIRITDASANKAMAFIGTEDPDGDGTRCVLYTTDSGTTKGYAYKASGFSESDTPLTYNVYDVTTALETGFEGNFRLIKVRNKSGSNGYITFLRLRADKGTRSAKTAARGENSQSQQNVGRRRIQHETLHIDRYGSTTDKGSALERVTKRISQRANPKERLVLDMNHGTRANLMQILHRSISDRINVVYTPMGISDSYHVERQTVNVREGGMLLECEWELQQAIGGGWGFARWETYDGNFVWG